MIPLLDLEDRGRRSLVLLVRSVRRGGVAVGGGLCLRHSRGLGWDCEQKQEYGTEHRLLVMIVGPLDLGSS